MEGYLYFFLICLFCLASACEKDDPLESDNPIQTVSDYDGNVYKTLRIVDPWWMASNLKTTHYADGSAIRMLEGDSDWEALAMDAKAYCYYGNDGNVGAFTYGALYTWSAALNGAVSSNENPSQIQGVCPEGWHLPSDAEWKELELFLGMDEIDADTTGPRGLSIGSQLAVNRDLLTDGLLKSNPVFGHSGFMALPGRGRCYDGTFGHVGDNANFWTAT